MPEAFTALCCACGTRRTTRSTRAWRQLDPNHSPGELGSARCVITRKCRTCDAMTPHAYLRPPDDPARDIAETMTPDARSARRKVEQAVNDLEALGVDVRFHSLGEPLAGTLFRALDDEDGRVLLVVDDESVPSIQAGVLDMARSILLERMGDGIWMVRPARDGNPAIAMVPLMFATG